MTGVGTRDGTAHNIELAHQEAVAKFVRASEREYGSWIGALVPILASTEVLSRRDGTRKINLSPKRVFACTDMERPGMAARMQKLESLNPAEFLKHIADRPPEAIGYRMSEGSGCGTLHVAMEADGHALVAEARRRGIDSIPVKVYMTSPILPEWTIYLTPKSVDGIRHIEISAGAGDSRRRVTAVIPGSFEEQARSAHLVRGGRLEG